MVILNPNNKGDHKANHSDHNNGWFSTNQVCDYITIIMIISLVPINKITQRMVGLVLIKKVIVWPLEW